MTRLLSAAICYAIILTALLAVLFLNMPPARGQPISDEAAAWMRSWIPTFCCSSNSCCREVTERDVTSLPEDWWRINASGQVLKRTGNSPDGKWYRCYCDYIDGKWVVHPTAYTRCLFTPIQAF